MSFNGNILCGSIDILQGLRIFLDYIFFFFVFSIKSWLEVCVWITGWVSFIILFICNTHRYFYSRAQSWRVLIYLFIYMEISKKISFLNFFMKYLVWVLKHFRFIIIFVFASLFSLIEFWVEVLVWIPIHVSYLYLFWCISKAFACEGECVNFLLFFFVFIWQNNVCVVCADEGKIVCEKWMQKNGFQLYFLMVTWAK